MISEFEKYKNYQIENSKNIITENIIDMQTIRYIGGLDISFHKTNDQSCAYLTVYDIDEKKIIYEKHNLCKMQFPYVSGYLGIREAREYIKLLDEINGKPYYPHLLMIDGFGILHPRNFGSASHIGYELKIPSIGVAKTLMCIDGLNEKKIKKNFKQNCTNKGDYIELIGNTGIIYGVALKTSDNATNPMYVSIGHGINIKDAINFVIITSTYKIPEPIRNSDIKSKLYFN